MWSAEADSRGNPLAAANGSIKVTNWSGETNGRSRRAYFVIGWSRVRFSAWRQDILAEVSLSPSRQILGQCFLLIHHLQLSSWLKQHWKKAIKQAKNQSINRLAVRRLNSYRIRNSAVAKAVLKKFIMVSLRILWLSDYINFCKVKLKVKLSLCFN
jgi:hypothetical protein